MILGKLMLDYDYLTDLYSENDINKLHLRIIHMIEQIVKDPEITLEDIEVLTQDEKNTIINVFRRPATTIKEEVESKNTNKSIILVINRLNSIKN